MSTLDELLVKLVRTAVAAEIEPLRRELAELRQTQQGNSAPIGDVLTIAEACSAIRCSKSKLYELISSSDLPTVRLGRRQLVRRTDLERLLSRGSK